MIITLLVLGFVVMSVRGALFLVRDANRQARAHAGPTMPDTIAQSGRVGEPGDWTALDDYQLNRLLKDSS